MGISSAEKLRHAQVQCVHQDVGWHVPSCAADSGFHVMRKIASAVAEQTMGGSRPSSKDWIGAPRHTTTCTRNQVCLHNGKLSPVPCKVSDTQRRFLLKFQVRLLTQGIRHPEHFKTPLRRRCSHGLRHRVAHTTIWSDASIYAKIQNCFAEASMQWIGEISQWSRSSTFPMAKGSTSATCQHHGSRATFTGSGRSARCLRACGCTRFRIYFNHPPDHQAASVALHHLSSYTI